MSSTTKDEVPIITTELQELVTVWHIRPADGNNHPANSTPITVTLPALERHARPGDDEEATMSPDEGKHIAKLRRYNRTS